MTPAETLKRAEAKAKREKLELAMLQQIKAHKFGRNFIREYEFCPGRKWRFDFAFARRGDLVALECEGIGGTSRHTTIAGFTADAEKYNEAAILGWRVLRVTGAQIKSGKAIEWLQRALGAEA